MKWIWIIGWLLTLGLRVPLYWEAIKLRSRDLDLPQKVVIYPLFPIAVVIITFLVWPVSLLQALKGLCGKNG